MTKRPLPPLAELIAMTPGAQSREQAQASIKRRRERRLKTEPAVSPADFATPEPIPPNIVDHPIGFGKDFWTRFAAKDKPPPRGSKPRVVVNNDPKRKKKPDKDDDPEPPKAA